MSSLITDLGIDKHSRDEQLQLVGEILAKLEIEPRPELSASQCAELDRRLASLEAGQTKLSGWDETRSRILASLKK